MAKINSLNLEFLRKGPAHNQLISPLTDYLALCGSNQAVSIQLPFEHSQFMDRLAALQYKRSTQQNAEQRRHQQLQIKEMAVSMSEVLSKIPGLISELGKAQHDEGLIHLRLVLSAAELALLPFELSYIPKGFGGKEDAWLSLLTNEKVCITRRVRTAAEARFEWPKKPKILFVAASPQGMTVPLKAHLLALHKVIQPWLGFFDQSDKKAIFKEVAKYLTVLPQATLTDIAEACKKEQYTHVHVLAHGVQDDCLPGKPFGIALHHQYSPQKLDIVSGERFASALGGICAAMGQHIDLERAIMPTVVTLASCNSSDEESRIYGGASFAHDVHQSGVSLVVASQFPLSFQGSIHMTEVLYEKLLWGIDPRCALYELRHKLAALQPPQVHDWASLVAYETLPGNLEEQLLDVQYHASKRAINAALSVLDSLLAAPEHDWKGITKAVDQLNDAKNRMPCEGKYAIEGKGLHASSEKRLAQSLFKADLKEKVDQIKTMQKSVEKLVSSAKLYRQAFNNYMNPSEIPMISNKTLHWPLVQALSLDKVMGKEIDLSLWQVARISAEMERDNKQIKDSENAFAYASLSELYLILLSGERFPDDLNSDQAKKKAGEHLRAMLDVTSPNSFARNSTLRQLKRYRDWWCTKQFQEAVQDYLGLSMKNWDQLFGAVQELIALFPGEENAPSP